MILLTAFEPFGGSSTNPSQALAEEFERRSFPNVHTQVLPTSYVRSAAILTERLRTLRPSQVVMLGLHGGAQHLRYEQVALNLNHSAKADNDGETRLLRHIRPAGPVGYWNRLPYEALRNHAERLGETLELSRDAGGFVCNHAFYTALDFAHTELPDCHVGFIHVPPFDAAREARLLAVLEAWLSYLG
jgi:pyroglutamyl-peptidase